MHSKAGAAVEDFEHTIIKYNKLHLTGSNDGCQIEFKFNFRS